MLTPNYRQIEQLKRCEIIPEAAVKELCLKAKEILMDEGNIQYVDSPVTVSLDNTHERPADVPDLWRHSRPVL